MIQLVNSMNDLFVSVSRGGSGAGSLGGAQQLTGGGGGSSRNFP